MKNVICFVGPPGSGKGTQSSRCFEYFKDKFSLHRFSVGDELRALSQADAKGNLADLNTVESIVAKNIARPEVNIIIDGYPRSSEQLDILLKKLHTSKITSVQILDLHVEDHDLLISRLNYRNNCFECGYTGSEDECPKCDVVLTKRFDDLDETIIRRRLEIYQANHTEILDRASKTGLEAYRIDASVDLETAFETTKQILRELLIASHVKVG